MEGVVDCRVYGFVFLRVDDDSIAFCRSDLFGEQGRRFTFEDRSLDNYGSVDTLGKLGELAVHATDQGQFWAGKDDLNPQQTAMRGRQDPLEFEPTSDCEDLFRSLRCAMPRPVISAMSLSRTLSVRPRWGLVRLETGESFFAIAVIQARPAASLPNSSRFCQSDRRQGGRWTIKTGLTQGRAKPWQTWRSRLQENERPLRSCGNFALSDCLGREADGLRAEVGLKGGMPALSTSGCPS